MNTIVNARPRPGQATAAPAVWSQTGTGRAMDLINPTPEMIDFDIDIAEATARIARFTGHVRSGIYSVAQHNCLAADAALHETGNASLAAYLLLHDAHEAFMGDIATPVAQAIAVHAQLSQEPCPHEFRQRFANAAAAGIVRLKMTLDAAIHAKAGLAWPPTPEIAAAIKSYDIRMLATEKRQLLAPPPYPWHPAIEAAEPIRMVGKLAIWPWPKAAEQWRQRARQLLPAVKAQYSPEPQRAGPPTARTPLPVRC